jgi:hypothetical protein
MLGSAAGIWYTHRATRGWGEKVSPAINKRFSIPNRITVSLPSYEDLLCLGILALQKPSFNEDKHLELLGILF